MKLEWPVVHSHQDGSYPKVDGLHFWVIILTRTIYISSMSTSGARSRPSWHNTAIEPAQTESLRGWTHSGCLLTMYSSNTRN